jgi:hypothetical protein
VRPRRTFYQGLLGTDELRQQDFRDHLAGIAARLSKQAGRGWRRLEDTAVSVQLPYAAWDDYADFRHGAGYYNESA